MSYYYYYYYYYIESANSRIADKHFIVNVFNDFFSHIGTKWLLVLLYRQLKIIPFLNICLGI